MSLIGWWVAVRGRSIGREILVYDVKDQGTIKYRFKYNGMWKPSTMRLDVLHEYYERKGSDAETDAPQS